MVKSYSCDIAIIGAGIVGIAVAYYLKNLDKNTSVVLLDSVQPMSLTSAQSGENYRNWWPHPVMTAFTDRSIDLMEALARETDNLINMNRRGYVLSTRADNIDQLMRELVHGYSKNDGAIRVHEHASSASYEPPISPDWQSAPAGVDVIRNSQLIQNTFPSYAKDISTVIHVRRAGAISAQQMGQHMLQVFKSLGGIHLQAHVNDIDANNGFSVNTEHAKIAADRLVNAAGPFINSIANMIGTQLPVTHTAQQKIAFKDTLNAIPRQMPFSIDLDAQTIDWSTDELHELLQSTEHRWLTEEMSGAIHCRPDGGDKGTWVKLGWAYNGKSSVPTREHPLSDEFPEIVLRAASRLNPSLKAYVDHMPTGIHHYGGFYTLTDENWPLIGEMEVEGSFVVGAMSGFGTMAACAAGDLCARVMMDSDVPSYANALSPQRYQNQSLMHELRQMAQRGIL